VKKRQHSPVLREINPDLADLVEKLEKITIGLDEAQEISKRLLASVKELQLKEQQKKKKEDFN